MANILVACEYSGIVRDEFIARGHTAISCDLLPTESPGPHIQGDVRKLDLSGYDLVIAHPPCTYLASSGARWWAERQQEQQEALELVEWFFHLPVKRLALENPVGIISTLIRKPDQIIQPWMFGEGEVKTTCLWLKNVPPLMATVVSTGRYQRCWKMPASKDRGKMRSKTYKGIAMAMSEQWGCIDA